MSKSNNTLTWAERKSKINSIIVDMTESSFFTEKQNDDAGAHLMVYLPDTIKQTFEINVFRQNIYKEIGSSRMCIAYVSEAFIKNKIAP